MGSSKIPTENDPGQRKLYINTTYIQNEFKFK